MVRGIEDLRTPLSKIIQLDKELRGTLSGFMMPAFVIDLPGGGGKRLVSTYDSYDAETGVATYSAPGLPGKKGKMVYTYHDPVSEKVTKSINNELHQEPEQAREQNVSLESFDNPAVPPPQPSIPLSVARRQIPPFIYEPSPPRTSTAANVRQTAIKPKELAPHIGITTWQPSAAAA